MVHERNLRGAANLREEFPDAAIIRMTADKAYVFDTPDDAFRHHTARLDPNFGFTH